MDKVGKSEVLRTRPPPPPNRASIGYLLYGVPPGVDTGSAFVNHVEPSFSLSFCLLFLPLISRLLKRSTFVFIIDFKAY